jgi:glycosyltransferase involved in cell wall biosynthesis
LNTANREAAIIYTHSLLEGSMTFIKSHAEALTRYVALYAGSHYSDGLPLPEKRTFLINRGTASGFLQEAVFRTWGWAPAITAKLRQHDPKIIHAHFGTCGPAAMALAESLRIPFVVTFHGQDATKSTQEALKSHRGRELQKKKDALIKNAGLFIAVSDFIRQRLMDQNYPEDRVVVHRNGIDLELFKPNAAEERKRTVLFVGRFVEKKGIEYLIEAAKILDAQSIDFELVLIGTGPLESALRQSLSNTNIRCRFEGFLPPDEVRSWLERASVVAVPSVTAQNGDSEGLPTVILEAQAMAAPIVATRHSGIPEGVVEGRSAELVNERDTAGLAERIRGFLDSPAKVRAFGEAGRQFVIENFDIRKQVSGLEDLYDRARSKHVDRK